MRYNQEDKKYERSISSSLTPFMYFSGMTNLFGSHFAACGESQNRNQNLHTGFITARNQESGGVAISHVFVGSLRHDGSLAGESTEMFTRILP